MSNHWYYTNSLRSKKKEIQNDLRTSEKRLETLHKLAHPSEEDQARYISFWRDILNVIDHELLLYDGKV